MAVKQEFTEYNDINEVLEFLSQGVKGIFGDGLVGFYLTGSLSYGDFEPGRSDIDLAAVLEVPANPEKINEIGKLHLETEQKFRQWANRIECSYIPRAMLAEVLPPKEPRPYFGAGIFYPAADYGNEWLINRHFLYQYGVAIIGPDFKTLAAPVETKNLKEACVRDLRQEWAHKINDGKYLANSHYQSYVVLNLCRIIYTVANGEAASKKVEAVLAKKFVFPPDIMAKIKANKAAWGNYRKFSLSYRRIRIGYIEGARFRPEEFKKRLDNFVEKTEKNKTFGFGGIEKYY